MNASLPPPLPSSAIPSSALATRGVTPDLRHAWGGIWRISYPRVWSGKAILGLAWKVALLGVIMVFSVSTGDDTGFHAWAINVYLTTVVPIIAFLSGAGAIRDDMKPAGVDYLLTRPVPRPAFVVARFVSHLVCMQGTTLVTLAVVLGVGWYREIGDLAAIGPMLTLAQVVSVTAFLALGFLFGALTSRYLVLGILYAGIIEVGLGQIPITLSQLSVLRHVKAYLLPLTPDGGATLLEPQGAFVTVSIIAAFTLVWLAGAALVFSLQEFAGQRPKDA